MTAQQHDIKCSQRSALKLIAICCCTNTGEHHARLGVALAPAAKLTRNVYTAQLVCTLTFLNRQVLANSWELQQLNHTAPKVCQATLDRLALPRKARVQQEVTHSLHDVNDFAKWKAAQLAQKRAARGIREVEQQMLLSSQKEALEGWHRQQEQVRDHMHATTPTQTHEQLLMSFFCAISVKIQKGFILSAGMKADSVSNLAIITSTASASNQWCS